MRIILLGTGTPSPSLERQGSGYLMEVFGPQPLTRATELLFGDDGVFGPDIRARRGHQSSRDVYQKRGAVLPRQALALGSASRLCTRSSRCFLAA